MVDPGPGLPELGAGIVYSAGLEPLLEAHPELVDVIEIEPQTTWLEHPDRPGEILVRPDIDAHLAALPFAKLVHSIGTPVGGSVAGSDVQFPLLRDTVRKLAAPWASEHLAFNLTPDFFTGFFLPPRQTAAAMPVYAEAIERLANAVAVPLAIETGVNYLRPRSDEIPDGQFVAELVDRSNCGILLDLHNIYANERNGRQSMAQFLQQIPLDRVWEIHVAGGFEFEGYWLDAHSGAMPDRLFALAREIVPHLPNLKAIVFEVFTSFLPRFGDDGVRAEMERVQELWGLRQTRKIGSGAPPDALTCTGVIAVGFAAAPIAASVATTANTSLAVSAATKQVSPVPDVAAWERALGGLVVGQDPSGNLARDLAADKGVAVIRSLIHEFRASMVVAVYRLSSRLLMLALTPDVFRAILEDFWTKEPPHQYAASEAEAFMNYLRAKNLRMPQLQKLLEFEKAAMDTVLDGQARVVHFSADPFPLLRALAEGRLPDIIPQEGDYEIELKPDGPVMVAGIEFDEVRAAFPFH